MARSEKPIATARRGAFMGINFGYRGEVLTGQGEMGFLVDTRVGVLLSSKLPVAGHAPLPFSNITNAAGMSLSPWWYWCTSEEAIALA
jgi:hypothetical protein